MILVPKRRFKKCRSGSVELQNNIQIFRRAQITVRVKSQVETQFPAGLPSRGNFRGYGFLALTLRRALEPVFMAGALLPTCRVALSIYYKTIYSI